MIETLYKICLRKVCIIEFPILKSKYTYIKKIGKELKQWWNFSRKNLILKIYMPSRYFKIFPRNHSV